LSKDFLPPWSALGNTLSISNAIHLFGFFPLQTFVAITMRPALLAWALTAALTSAFAAPPGNDRKGSDLSKDATSGGSPLDDGEGAQYTVFNDIKVPPMKEIEGPEFADTIKDGYW